MAGVRQRLRQARPVARLSFRAMASGADLYAADLSTMPKDAVKHFGKLMPLKSRQDGATFYCLRNPCQR
jgi:hypothetical protein